MSVGVVEVLSKVTVSDVCSPRRATVGGASVVAGIGAGTVRSSSASRQTRRIGLRGGNCRSSRGKKRPRRDVGIRRDMPDSLCGPDSGGQTVPMVVVRGVDPVLRLPNWNQYTAQGYRGLVGPVVQEGGYPVHCNKAVKN